MAQRVHARTQGRRVLSLHPRNRECERFGKAGRDARDRSRALKAHRGCFWRLAEGSGEPQESPRDGKRFSAPLTTTTSEKGDPNMGGSKFVYVIIIRTTAERCWDALTKPEFTKAYWAGTTQQSEWKKGSSWKALTPDG